MTIRFATKDEIARWDELLITNPDGGNVFQATEMAETKRQNNWTPRYLWCGDIAVTVLEKRVPLLGAFWYLPKGPGVQSAGKLIKLIEPLQAFARAQKVFAIRIEPEVIETDEAKTSLEAAGLIPVGPIQPNHSTVVVDLSPSVDEIMANFNQKGRNALRRAEREGAKAYAAPFNDANAHIMYDLLTSTAAGRFESSLRSFGYYVTFWKRYIDSGHGSLFLVEYNNQIVASAFCMYLGKKGLYKDGASIPQKTVYGASHLLQWEVMKWMKERGVQSYDLCGSPHSSEVSNPENHFYGIGRFKTSFNKHVTDYVGCYDIIIRPKPYRYWQRIGERITISLSWRLKRRQWF